MASDSVITQIAWVKKCLDDMYPRVIEGEDDFTHLLTAVMHFCEYQGYSWDACHREAHDIFLRERKE